MISDRLIAQNCEICWGKFRGDVNLAHVQQTMPPLRLQRMFCRGSKNAFQQIGSLTNPTRIR